VIWLGHAPRAAEWGKPEDVASGVARRVWARWRAACTHRLMNRRTHAAPVDLFHSTRSVRGHGHRQREEGAGGRDAWGHAAANHHGKQAWWRGRTTEASLLHRQPCDPALFPVRAPFVCYFVQFLRSSRLDEFLPFKCCHLRKLKYYRIITQKKKAHLGSHHNNPYVCRSQVQNLFSHLCVKSTSFRQVFLCK
jgi:hypothetical protein